MRILIGNDLVDLTNPDIANKHNEERFLKRVLAPSEIKKMKSTSDPKKLLWLLWAGKESAYKVLKKLMPEMIFSHSKIVVDIDEKVLYGTVTYGEYVISIRWLVATNWLHSVAVLKEDEKQLDVFEYEIKELGKVSVKTDDFTPEEALSVYSLESAGVRNLTKDILNKYKLENVEIIRSPLEKKFSPPELYVDRTPLKYWDLSMSHDGNFVSCAVSKRQSL